MPTVDLGPCECCGDYPDSTCYYDGEESFRCVADGDEPPEGWTAVGKECPRGCCCFWLQPNTCGGVSLDAPCDVAPPETFQFQERISGIFVSGGYRECGDNATDYMNALPELPPITFTLSGVSGNAATYQGNASGNGWSLETPSNVTATLNVCLGIILLANEIWWERSGGLVRLRVFYKNYISPPVYPITPSAYPQSICDGMFTYPSAYLDGIAVVDASLVTPCDDGRGPDNDPVYYTNPEYPFHDAPSLTFRVTPPNSPPICYPEVAVDCGVCCESDGGCTAGVDGGLQSQSDCEDAGGTWLWNGDCDDCELLENPLP